MLLSLAQANTRISRGDPLTIAGSSSALAALQPGNWIGGSIPYFITDRGGCCDRTKVFVEEIRLPITQWSIRTYRPDTLSSIATDAFGNGYSYVIIPANSGAHLEYAMRAPHYPEIFMKPVIGWISGVAIDELASATPAVVDGRSAKVLFNDAVVLHVELSPEFQPVVHTVNLFQPGDGPTLRFLEAGFSASTAVVDGKRVDLVRFMRERNWDPRRPLVADYSGTNVNVSIKAVDETGGLVSFYAPVFPDVDYREAAPVGDYVEAFSKLVPGNVRPLLSCNCVLNYLYGKLEGRSTGPFTGPATFGEIAHQLLNQTLVYLADANGTPC